MAFFSRRPEPVTARQPEGLVALTERAATGDVEATGQLLKALAPDLIRSAQALMGAAHPDVDDVVQQALIALVQALPNFRGECSPRHFAQRIVARIAVHFRHKAHVRGDRYDGAIDVDAMPGQQPHLGDTVDAGRRRELVRALLDTLPEEQAETLALRIGLGFSLGEVAEATGVPLNTVRSRIRLAKEALRRRIEANASMLEALEVES